MTDTPANGSKWRQQRASQRNVPLGAARQWRERMRRVLHLPVWPTRKQMAEDSRTLPGGWLETLERTGELSRQAENPATVAGFRGWLRRVLRLGPRS